MANRKSSRVPLDLGMLAARVELFRLSGTAKKHPAVQSWLAGEPAELRAIAGKWFSYMHQCGDDVFELIHDGCPVACVQDAAFAYVNTFKSHFNVGFFYGAMLDDPAGLLEGNGKRMRHVTMRVGSSPDGQALKALIDLAYSDVRARRR